MIGTGGKVIREIVEKTGAKINIEDDGTVKIASADGESIKAALKWIRSLTAEPEVGEIYDGKIVKVMDFGAFVNFFGPKDGLVHVSELAAQRVAKPSRCGQGRPGREGEAAGLRRSRQGAPFHEAGGPDDRRRPFQEAGCSESATRRRPDDKFSMKNARGLRWRAFFFCQRCGHRVRFWPLFREVPAL